MDLQLAGRTALVTGSSAGIGQAIALALAGEGVRLCLVARREGKLQELASEIAALGHAPKPLVIVADLLKEGAPETVVSQAVEKLGKIDILVNSAGGSRPLSLDASEDQWQEGMLINFTRLRQLTHAVLRDMGGDGFGRIINITGSSEPRGLNVANPAKAAVHAWAKGLSREIGRRGITINSIAPGRIRSEQIARMYPTAEDERRFAETETAVGYFGEAKDLAVVALFLASPLARYVTGTVVHVDGGVRRYAF